MNTEGLEGRPGQKDIARCARVELTLIKLRGVLTWFAEPTEQQDDTVAGKLLASVFDDSDALKSFAEEVTVVPQRKSVDRAQFIFRIFEKVGSLKWDKLYLESGRNVKLLSVREGITRTHLVLSSSFRADTQLPGLAMIQERGHAFTVPENRLSLEWVYANYYGQDLPTVTHAGQEFTYELSKMSPEDAINLAMKRIQ